MKLSATVLFVEDIERSKTFYTDVLQQEIKYDFGKNITFESDLSLWEINSEHPISTLPSKNKTENTFELYFESGELEPFLERAEQAGAEFLHKTREENWGQKTFRFFDPDRHLIEIGEPLEVFIKRMHTEGLSLEHINKKSGVSLNLVKKICSI